METFGNHQTCIRLRGYLMAVTIPWAMTKGRFLLHALPLDGALVVMRQWRQKNHFSLSSCITFITPKVEVKIELSHFTLVY